MPKSPLKPTFANAVVNFALSAANLRSHASAMPSPAPAHAPLMAATVGLVLACSRPESRWIDALPIDLPFDGPVCGGRGVAHRRHVAARTEAASRAGDDDAPHRRVVGAALERSNRRIEHRPRERVQPLRPIQGEDRHAVADLHDQVGSSPPEFAIVFSWNGVAPLSHDPRRSTSGLGDSKGGSWPGASPIQNLSAIEYPPAHVSARTRKGRLDPCGSRCRSGCRRIPRSVCAMPSSARRSESRRVP